MCSSNCCFLTCIQISQEAGKVVWYSHLFQNFPQFTVIHTVQGFGIVNKAEIDVIPELSCFFHDPADVGNLISGSRHYQKTKEWVVPQLLEWSSHSLAYETTQHTKTKRTFHGCRIKALWWHSLWTVLLSESKQICLLPLSVSFPEFFLQWNIKILSFIRLKVVWLMVVITNKGRFNVCTFYLEILWTKNEGHGKEWGGLSWYQ